MKWVGLFVTICACSQIVGLDQRPNILVIVVDELRKPPVYEEEALEAWSAENLKTIRFLQEHGVSFEAHYAASTACAPSRTSIFTGQYPTVHGVSQTDGGAKPAFDPTMFWLPPYSVPTMGNFFSEANYRTFYIGKWHISKDDLYIPGTQNVLLTYNGITGVRDAHLENVYRSANMLSSYGFDNGWIGPEPHGAAPHQSGGSASVGVSGRDLFYADSTIELLENLDKESQESPWLIVCSFVNPHDITLYGDVTKLLPIYDFELDQSLPDIPEAPTANEDLGTKPLAQASYQEQYQNGFQPTTDTMEYRKLYYTLQKKVDLQMGRVLSALNSTRFKENTIIVFTSDHGDLLGAHGNFQKWFNSYEETIHVPLVVYFPEIAPKKIQMLTSHVDLLPTLCGFAKIDVDAAVDAFESNFSNAQPLVGRDLSSLIMGDSSEKLSSFNQPILFLTYDQILTGSSTVSPMGTPYQYVSQPAFIHTVIAEVEGRIWKLSVYFENKAFLRAPLPCTCSLPIQMQELSDRVQLELYDLTNDPIEAINLIENGTELSKKMEKHLLEVLQNQLEIKAKAPKSKG